MAYYATLGDKELELRNDLGVLRSFKKEFRQTYTQVVSRLETMTEDEWYKFIYVSMTSECKDSFGKLSDFVDWIESEESGIGVVDIMDLIQEINLEIQYPGKTPEERKKLMMDKMK